MSDKVWWVVKSGDIEEFTEFVNQHKVDVNVKNAQGARKEKDLTRRLADFCFLLCLFVFLLT